MKLKTKEIKINHIKTLSRDMTALLEISTLDETMSWSILL